MTTVRHSYLGLSDIGYHFYTVFLLTEHNILDAIIPGVLFPVASAPLCSLVHTFPIGIWGGLHLLLFTLANQIKAPEDMVNKPWRPIPAGRISIRDATILRWLIAPLCPAYSSLHSIRLVFASIEMQLFTWWYNEMGGGKNWLWKNVISALMYGSTEPGATLLVGCDASRVSETGKLAVQFTMVVFFTTVHCQDFEDVAGDRLVGRRTAPIMFSLGSRLVVGLGLPARSYVLCCIWDIDWFCTLAFVAYGCFVGGHFLLLRTRKYYSVWFSIHHLLPGYWNYFHGSDNVRGGELFQSIWDVFSGTVLLKVF